MVPDPTLAELLQRLNRLEDEAVIRDTLYAYGSGLDYGDRDQFLGCFASDASYYVDMRIRGSGALEFHGHDQLADYFDGHTHAPDAWHKHVTTNPTIVVRGDTASATSYFLRVDATSEAGVASVVASGRYLDQLVRRDGQWRILERRCQVENL
jgi:3-phenylpropionate/cinnamic acid dioxygenase small subunit